MGSIVSVKGLSSTLHIVFFKGESGYLDNHRMPTHSPLDREKARPEKEGKRAKRDKKGGKILSSSNFISFSFRFCVFKTGLMIASGLGGRLKEVRMCVYVCESECVSTGLLYAELLTSLYLCHTDTPQQLGDSSFVMYGFIIISNEHVLHKHRKTTG